MYLFSFFFLVRVQGITLSMLELDAFLKLIPELIAIGMRFNMKPTAYYEEKEYRVFYHAESEAFINLDMMIRFAAPNVPHGDCQKVCFFGYFSFSRIIVLIFIFFL